MALQSISNVKNDLSPSEELNKDDGYKAQELESSNEPDEDLEDGEILDDEDEDTRKEISKAAPVVKPEKKVASSPAHVAHYQQRQHLDANWRKHIESTRNSPNKNKKRRHMDDTEQDDLLDVKKPKNEGKNTDELDEDMFYVRGSSPASKDSYEVNSGSEDDMRQRIDKIRNKKWRVENSKIRRDVKKREDCMFYLQGKCQRGDDCPYSHTADLPKKMELCKFYLTNTCVKKEKCLYMHSDFPCKYFHAGLKCDVESCLFSHEPLTEVTKSILLKHIETAPKEILGNFPRLPRNENGEIVLPSEKNKPVSAVSPKKIPSLFDIKVEPPPELKSVAEAGIKELAEMDKASDEEAKKQWKMPKKEGTQELQEEDEEEVEEEDFDTQLRKVIAVQRERDRKEKNKRRDSTNSGNNDDSDEQKSLPPVASASGGSSFFRNIIKNKIEASRGKDDEEDQVQDEEIVEEKEEEEEEENGEEEIENEVMLEDKKVEEEDENLLIVTTQDDDDTEGGKREHGEDKVAVPTHLPRKQRELFMRIQQQQAQRDAAKDSDAGDRTPEYKPDSDDDLKNTSWYSSDSENEDETLTDLLKNLSKQLPSKEDNKGAMKMDSKQSSNLNIAGGLDLSKINISPDLTNLLSSIAKTNWNASKDKEQIKVAPTVKNEEKAAPTARDPRLTTGRDPRAKVKDTDLRTTPPIPILTEPPKIVPLRVRQPPPVDVDLRQNFGDVDLREFNMLGLPFKPLPIPPLCEEIDASFNSHPPMEFKLKLAWVNLPDYSHIKINESNVYDKQISQDPRLKKYVEAVIESMQSPLSPPPLEPPRPDPRQRSQPQPSVSTNDPRRMRHSVEQSPPHIHQAPPPMIMHQPPPQIIHHHEQPMGRNQGLLGPPPMHIMPPIPGQGILGPGPGPMMHHMEQHNRPYRGNRRGRGGAGWNDRRGRGYNREWRGNRNSHYHNPHQGPRYNKPTATVTSSDMDYDWRYDEGNYNKSGDITPPQIETDDPGSFTPPRYD